MKTNHRYLWASLMSWYEPCIGGFLAPRSVLLYAGVLNLMNFLVMNINCEGNLK